MILLFLISLFGFQDPSETIQANSTVDKSVVNIGDKLLYQIMIEYDKAYKIETPGYGVNLGYFEIKDYRILPIEEINNKIIEKIEYTISTYDTGSYVIPPYPVAFYSKSDRSDFQIIEAPEILIRVNSIFLNDSTVKIQPKDIKGSIDAPFNYQWYYIFSAILLIIILVIYLYVKYFRKKVQLKAEEIEPLKAHEIALLELEKLSGFDSEIPEEINGYYTQLSFICRQYIENRFRLSALEETMDELRQSLTQLPISSKQYDRLINHLEFAELVKFAKTLPQSEDFKKIWEAMTEFVMDTKLVDNPQSMKLNQGFKAEG